MRSRPLVTAAAIAALLAVPALAQESNDPGIEGVEIYEDLSYDHVSGPIDYDLLPPAGGPHSPMWQNCGVYDEPVITEVPQDGLGDEIVETVRRELKAVGSGNVAVIAPERLVDLVDECLARAEVEHGRATRQGLDRQVTVVPVGLAKGLELDAVVVVEPGVILRDEARGAQALYVALTRSTTRLSIVHTGDLPEVLR